MPLLAQRGEQVAWVRVLADRTGADAMSVSAGGVPRRAHVTGRESYQLRRVKPGGWSQSRYQRAAMEAWHHNAGDVTAATVELAERVGAEVVVVAGDVRATGMIAAQMPDRWQDLVVRTDAGSRAGGADQTLLDDLTVQTIAEVADQRVHAALDRFGTQEDVGAGLDAVVAALQRNQVDTMLIVDDPSADGQLWIGPAATDIATEPGQLTAVAEPERVRADAALVRCPGGHRRRTDRARPRRGAGAGGRGRRGAALRRPGHPGTGRCLTRASLTRWSTGCWPGGFRESSATRRRRSRHLSRRSTPPGTTRSSYPSATRSAPRSWQPGTPASRAVRASASRPAEPVAPTPSAPMPSAPTSSAPSRSAPTPSAPRPFSPRPRPPGSSTDSSPRCFTASGTSPSRGAAPELVDEALRAATPMWVARRAPGIDVRLVLDELSGRLPRTAW